MENKIEFEKALKELEEIVNKIQSGKASLDESLKLFERGKEIVTALEKELKEAEAKVEKVVDID